MTTWSIEPDDERLAALGEFAAGAGHEINNPLATIVSRVQQLLKDETDPQRRYSLGVIAGQAYRIRDMIGDVMTFARPPAPQRVGVDVTGWLRTLLDPVVVDYAAAGVMLRTDVAADFGGRFDPAQGAIVVHELLRNARQAVTGIANPVIVVRAIPASAEGWRLVVEDNGRGFTDLERRHAFDPFFSGRQAGRGLGFGLCKVWRIVTGHGGTITIDGGADSTLVCVEWRGSEGIVSRE